MRVYMVNSKSHKLMQRLMCIVKVDSLVFEVFCQVTFKSYVKFLCKVCASVTFLVSSDAGFW